LEISNLPKKLSMENTTLRNSTLEFPLIAIPSEIRDHLGTTIMYKSEVQIMKFDYNKFNIKDLNLNDIDLNISQKYVNSSERSQVSKKFSNNNINSNNSFILYKNPDSHKLIDEHFFANEQQLLQKSKTYMLDKFSNISNIEKPQGNSIANLESEIDKIDLSKKIIIIIDDNKYIRDSVRNIIEKILLENQNLHLFDILEGNDGIDLLKFSIDYIYSDRIQLVITDENMEFMQGSESIKILRDFEIKKKIPKYFIFSSTSFEDQNSIDIILKAGADKVLNKPLSKEKLLMEIKNFGIFE